MAMDGERRHHRGCHCKRSGCLKNYCECYEAKVPCMAHCKCIGCKNVDDEPPRGPDGEVGGKAGVADATPVTGGATPTTVGANATSSSGGVNMLLAAHRRTELRPNLKAKLGSINASENGK